MRQAGQRSPGRAAGAVQHAYDGIDRLNMAEGTGLPSNLLWRNGTCRSSSAQTD